MSEHRRAILAAAVALSGLCACTNAALSPADVAADEIQEDLETQSPGAAEMSHTNPGMKSGVGL